MTYVCHSGGCPGADMTWETVGEEYGVTTYAYSFPDHVQYGKNPVQLSFTSLTDGFGHVTIASARMKRRVDKLPNYTRNLLSRNWFQVKYSEAIFAIGKFVDKTHTIVSGGTGWAVQMAVDNRKPVFLYDQESLYWYEYDYTTEMFVPCDTPTLTKQFAGIGTREITDDGIQAILDVYKKTFQNQDAD